MELSVPQDTCGPCLSSLERWESGASSPATAALQPRGKGKDPGLFYRSVEETTTHWSSPPEQDLEPEVEKLHPPKLCTL